MATKTLEARVKLKYDTTSAWKASTLILLQGETAYEVDSLTNPTFIKAKVGDGVNLFKDLKYVDSMTEVEKKTLINSIIDEYNTENDFVIFCGTADNNAEIPPVMTEVALNAAVEKKLDEILETEY